MPSEKSEKPEQPQKDDMIEVPFLPHLSEHENWQYFLIRLACSHAKLFDTCFIPRCRRYKRCDISHEEWKGGKSLFPDCPPCVHTEADRNDVIERLTFIVDQMSKYSPIYGKHLYSYKLPPRHRSRQ